MVVPPTMCSVLLCESLVKKCSAEHGSIFFETEFVCVALPVDQRSKVGVHTFNPSTQEAEAGGSLRLAWSI